MIILTTHLTYRNYTADSVLVLIMVTTIVISHNQHQLDTRVRQSGHVSKECIILCGLHGNVQLSSRDVNYGKHAVLHA